jgi:hypothetical protein
MFGVEVSTVIPEPDIVSALAEEEGEGIIVVDTECTRRLH